MQTAAAAVPPARRARAGPRWLAPTLAALAPLLWVLLVEGLVQSGLLDKRFFPAPSHVFGTLISLVASGHLVQHFLQTLARLVVGYACAMGIAALLALVLSRSWLAALGCGSTLALLGLATAGVSLPLIVLIFGTGDLMKAIVVGWAALWPLLFCTLRALERGQRHAADAGASFPAPSLEWVFSGLRWGLASGLLVLVAVEFLFQGTRERPATGIGYMIWQSMLTFSVETMHVAITTMAFFAYYAFLVLGAVEWSVRRWIGSPKAASDVPSGSP